MPAALAGLAAAAFIVGVVWARFHHDVVRIFEAKERLRRGALLLDVDRRGDLADRQPGVATNIPLEELASRVGELGSKDRSIVVHAHRFRDGVKAVHLLRRLGFVDVYDAAGARVKEKVIAAAVQVERARRYGAESGVAEEIDLVGGTP